MPGPLTAAGATPEPSQYASLTMDRSMTGLWTQRSPLRDADVPYLYGKFYAASRFDSLIDGLNREITARLTNARRSGSSRWNTNSFPAINSFYPFKYIQNSAEVLRVIADGQDGNIYDASANGKITLFTKSAGASKTRFLGVNTELFLSDAIDKKKIIRSALVWAAGRTFNEGQFLVDTNLNLQLAIGAQTATIVNIQITSNVATLFFSGTTPITIPPGTKLTLSGLTTIAALSGTTQTTTTIQSSQQVSFAFVHADVAFTVETGSATTGNAATGGVQPTWATTLGAMTQDGGQQWECRGSSVQDWMFAPATAAPSITQALAPSAFPAPSTSTWYAPFFAIIDSNGNVQQLTTAGTTGGVVPTWAIGLNATTPDGSAVWTNRGSAAWQAAHVYALNALVSATFTYWIQVFVEGDVVSCVLPFLAYGIASHHPQLLALLMTLAILFGSIFQGGGGGHWEQFPVTVTDTFLCTTPGTSGGSQPGWTDGLGTTTNDNTVVWTNQGTTIGWPAIGATQVLSLATKVLDPNHNTQTPTTLGKTGSVAPTWNTTKGAYTADGGQTWANAGPFGTANTGAWIYAFSGQNSITKDISTASPRSVPITPSIGNQPVLQGAGFTDTQIDSIVIWRTAQGGNTLLFLDVIPNPGAGNWIYTDTSADAILNEFIVAPEALSNNPPPTGFTGPVYHLQRIWGFSGNTVYYSGGPDTLVGSGNSSFPPLNNIPFPEQVIRLVPVTLNNGGILVFTTTNVYVILGTGTGTNPFYSTIYMASVGILGYDALDVVGSSLYMMTGKSKFISLDPSAGYVEAGFPIGDQFSAVTTGADPGIPVGALYSPASTFVTWHEQSSGDTAIYVADGAVGWFRFSPVASPETGYVWSPRAVIVPGTSAVQSVETSPGLTQLLIGPPSGGGPILFRDSTVFTDWSGGAPTTYPAWDVKGSIMLCESGEVAEIAHIALKSKAVGGRPVVSILLGEIAPTQNAPFDVLSITSTDPPDLPPSNTLYSDRYVAMQNGVCPKCDNFQLKIDYGSQAFGDELYMFSVYGAKYAERKQQ